jgi:putative transposase
LRGLRGRAIGGPPAVPIADHSNGLDDHGVLASVGSVGDAYDNALAESFLDSFKTELIADRVWRSRSQLELAIVAYIGWFNNQRLHESIGDIPPTEYEQDHPLQEAVTLTATAA